MQAKNKPTLHVSGSFLNHASQQDIVFIIDTISTAYAVAIMAKGRAIHCIYECKEITWRKADYVALFDFILSDVSFLSKVVISVPHPYLSPSKTIAGRIVRQMKFARSIRKHAPLEPNRTYVSSSVSSLLIGHRRRVNVILIDEGMSSVVARNRFAFRGNRLVERLKVAIGDCLLSFQFPISTPQITLTNDPHPCVVETLDYRDFESTAFAASLVRLKGLMEDGKCHVLVLLKGPSWGVAGHHDEAHQYGDAYTEFNLHAIVAYLNQFPKDVSPVFFLKSHPSLGSSNGKLTVLIEALKSRGLLSYDALSYIDFAEASSLPAEGVLRHLPFEHVLALDASSLLWNVAWHGEVKCFMPLKHIVAFSETEGGIHTELYQLQDRINQLMGQHVTYFDVESGPI